MASDISVLVIDRALRYKGREKCSGSLDDERKLLEEKGYRITARPNSDALSVEYDIMVMHPELGVAMQRIKKFHAEHPEIPMIVCSGHSFSPLKEMRPVEGYEHYDFQQDAAGVYVCGFASSRKVVELVDRLSEDIRAKRLSRKS
ncbi:MAG TPA: hypothetical protein VJC07_05180 [Candidatus Nanoarchaeia archaeon]|nr:hypothetical protein [Candidatus Nanoarchaeia archaeon]